MDRNPRFDVLRQSADPEIAGAIEAMVSAATDSALSRIDALRFAREHGFREEPVIDAFVHAARLGLFEMSFNLLCPGCGGVLDAGSTLKEMRDEYNCSLCAGSYEPTLDEMVEVSFTVSPAVRRIAAHLDYFGQTVNIAARVQGLATARSIFVTQPVVENEPVRDILSLRGLTPTPRRALLRGMADELTVYEIP